MDERLALLGLDAMRQGERVVVDVAFEQHLGAVSPAHANDRFRDAARHHHRGRGAERQRCVGDALRMTARRRRDDATPARVCIERRDLVERAADLERPGRLESLDLEVHFGAKLR